MTSIVDDVDFIAKRIKEIQDEKELGEKTPGSEQGVKIPPAEQEQPSRPEPGIYSYY